jgi:uncharacterized protein (TIGR02678 family)
MTRAAPVTEAARLAERAGAVRWLLAHPLTLAVDAPEPFTQVVRHRAFLTDWFADHAGWKLAVEPAAGLARLHKIPAASDPTRGARLTGRAPFDRRRYVLLCLVLAVCDEAGGQTTLASLARGVAELGGEVAGVAAFDATSGSERRALVDALRLLAELGVLRLRDGDAERYAQTAEGDALFDVNERALSHLVAAPVPPALAGDPARLLAEPEPESEEGQRLRHRHHAVRRLLDDPVLYFDDLPAETFDWVDHGRAYLYRLLQHDAGLLVERRAEGLAAIDPSGDTADPSFPDGGSTVKHAAILLAEQLVRRRTGHGERAPADEVVALTRGLHADHGEACHWSKLYPADAEGCARLADEAMELLESFALVARDADGWRIRPAIARFRPGAPTRSTRASRRAR